MIISICLSVCLSVSQSIFLSFFISILECSSFFLTILISGYFYSNYLGPTSTLQALTFLALLSTWCRLPNHIVKKEQKNIVKRHLLLSPQTHVNTYC